MPRPREDREADRSLFLARDDPDEDGANCPARSSWQPGRLVVKRFDGRFLLAPCPAGPAPIVVAIERSWPLRGAAARPGAPILPQGSRTTSLIFLLACCASADARDAPPPHCVCEPDPSTYRSLRVPVYLNWDICALRSATGIHNPAGAASAIPYLHDMSRAPSPYNHRAFGDSTHMKSRIAPTLCGLSLLLFVPAQAKVTKGDYAISARFLPGRWTGDRRRAVHRMATRCAGAPSPAKRASFIRIKMAHGPAPMAGPTGRTARPCRYRLRQGQDQVWKRCPESASRSMSAKQRSRATEPGSSATAGDACGSSKVPVVVLIHGSVYDSARDFWRAAAHVPGAGHRALVVYDKRGTGASGGAYNAGLRRSRQRDAIAAMKRARRLAGPRTGGIRLSGRQRGRDGVAPLAATGTVDFAIVELRPCCNGS